MTPLSDKSLAFGEKLAAATLGIDALYRKELGSEDNMDGLVVINMGQTKPAAYENYEEARAALHELAAESFGLPEEDRRLYYLQACMSLDSFCVWRQGNLEALTDQVGMFLHVDPAPASEAELDGWCKEAHAMLTSMGYAGDLKQQAEEWQRRNQVPAENVQQYMDDLMKVAREKCGNILELPVDYYHCEVERGGPFSARSDFDHRRVVVNIDPIYTKQALKHLVCHEAYPGHFVQFTLRKVLYERGIAAADGLLSVVNHSSSSTFEGIADMGMDFLGWIEDDDDRVFALLSTIKSASGTTVSYQKHVLGWSDEQIRTWLTKYSLIGGEGAVNSRMRFISNPASSALIWSYWRGDQGVESVWKRVAKEDRSRYFDYIYSRLHTVQSMQLFH